MSHRFSRADDRFRLQVETCEFPVSDFDHAAHVRLAYVYLVDNDADTAVEKMRESLLGLLQKAGIDPNSKYHETMTRAWVLAVGHFMNQSKNHESADAFIQDNPPLLDSRIMLSHYSAETLFSDQARRAWIEPDLEPIPKG